MKRLIILLLVAGARLSGQGSNYVTPNIQLQIPNFNQQGWQTPLNFDLQRLDQLISVSIATLPAAGNSKGLFIWVKDGVSPSDCSTGGGTYAVGCYSDGTSWTFRSVAASTAAVATAFAATPTGCSSPYFAISQAANGNFTCAQVQYSQIGGTLPGTTNINGTTVPTNGAANQIILTTASATGAWASLPACTDTGGNHLNYNTTLHSFTCGTSSSGGAGGTTGQILYNNAGAIGGFTAGGDCTIVASTGTVTCTKSSGTAFGSLAFAAYPSAGIVTSTGTSLGTAGVSDVTNVVGTGGTAATNFGLGALSLAAWPSSGLVASSGTAWRAPVYGDIFALFTGCSGTQYPGFDGACHTAGGGGSSLFTSYQFGSATALTGSGLYLQTVYPAIFNTIQTGAGTSGSPYLDTISFNSTNANFIRGDGTATNVLDGTFVAAMTGSTAGGLNYNSGSLSISSLLYGGSTACPNELMLLDNTHGTYTWVRDASGNWSFGESCGTSTFPALFNVGTSNGFQVNAAGNITSINGVSLGTWPANAIGALMNNGAGTFSYAALPSPGGVLYNAQYYGAGGIFTGLSLGTDTFFQGTSGAPQAGALPSCSGSSQALQYNTTTHALGCVTLGGGAFSSLSSGTNTAATMTVGTGASLGTSGTGAINATNTTAVNGGAVPVSANCLSSNSGSQIASGCLFNNAATGNLTVTQNATLNARAMVATDFTNVVPCTEASWPCSTDSTAGLQAWLNSGAASSSLFLPASKTSGSIYKISSTLTLNCSTGCQGVDLHGTGGHIWAAGISYDGMSTIRWANSTGGANTPMLVIQGSGDGVTIENLILDCNNEASTGLFLQQITGATVRNVWVTNNIGPGVVTTATLPATSTSITVASGSGILKGQHVEGSYIQTGTYVSAVSGTSVTLSLATTNGTTQTGVALAFVTTIQQNSAALAYAPSATLTVASTAGISVGDYANGLYIAPGTTVSSVPSGTTVTLSATPTNPSALSELVTFAEPQEYDAAIVLTNLNSATIPANWNTFEGFGVYSGGAGQIGLRLGPKYKGANDDAAVNYIFHFSDNNFSTTDTESIGMLWGYTDGNQIIGVDGGQYCGVRLLDVTSGFPGGNTLSHANYGDATAGATAICGTVTPDPSFGPYPNQFEFISTIGGGSGPEALPSEPYRQGVTGLDNYNTAFGYGPRNSPLFYSTTPYSPTFTFSSSVNHYFEYPYSITAGVMNFKGAIVELTGSGYYSVPTSGSNGNLRLYVVLDQAGTPIQLDQSDALAFPSSSSTANFSFDCKFVITGTGTVGITDAGSEWVGTGMTPVAGTWNQLSSTFDATAAHTIGIQGVVSTLGASTQMTIKHFDVKVLYPGTVY